MVWWLLHPKHNRWYDQGVKCTFNRKLLRWNSWAALITIGFQASRCLAHIRHPYANLEILSSAATRKEYLKSDWVTAIRQWANLNQKSVRANWQSKSFRGRARQLPKIEKEASRQTSRLSIKGRPGRRPKDDECMLLVYMCWDGYICIMMWGWEDGRIRSWELETFARDM